MNDPPIEASAVEAARRMFEAAPFVGHLGISLVDAKRGYCETALAEPGPALYQQSGSLHAGVMTTMADHTAGGALVTELESGLGVVSVGLSIQFLRPAEGGLRCVGETLKRGGRIGVAEATAYAEGGAGARAERPVVKATVTLAIVPWNPGG